MIIINKHLLKCLVGRERNKQIRLSTETLMVYFMRRPNELDVRNIEVKNKEMLRKRNHGLKIPNSFLNILTVIMELLF